MRRTKAMIQYELVCAINHQMCKMKVVAGPRAIMRVREMSGFVSYAEYGFGQVSLQHEIGRCGNTRYFEKSPMM